ncbi:MAG: biotin synthetase [Bdellovibrionales bacterium]
MSLKSLSLATKSWAEQRQIPVHYEAEVESTNDWAKDRALSEGDALVIYLTGHQTKGRGRGVNQWLDTGADENLVNTWSLQVGGAPQPISGPRVGLALFRTMVATWPSLSWSLKAPNDLLLNGLKMGGLLLETISNGRDHRLLIGLGLNILNHPRKFTEATHLSSHLESPLREGDWFQFLDHLRQEFSSAVQESQSTTLTPSACRDLTLALNANPKKVFTVKQISPQGDIEHSSGRISWLEL